MRKVLLSLLLLVSTSAVAEPEADLATEWSRLHYECRMGETREGDPLAGEIVQERCETRENVGFILLSHGHCWSASEQAWTAPTNDAAFCDEQPPR